MLPDCYGPKGGEKLIGGGLALQFYNRFHFCLGGRDHLEGYVL